MKLKLIAGAILIIALILLFFKRNTPSSAAPEEPKQEIADAPPIEDLPEVPPPNTPIGHQFTEDYGSASTSPKLDLEKVGRIVEGISSLIKNIDTRLISTNEQLSAFISGGNPEGLIYVSPDQPIFNDEGLLVDRWGSPLIIHPLGTNIIEIRSAGPDQTPYNDDDLIRDPTGGVYLGSDPKSPTSLAP